MTPSHDHATLFQAPAAHRDTEAADRSQPVADHRAEAMRALCHPFAVPAEPDRAPVR